MSYRKKKEIFGVPLNKLETPIPEIIEKFMIYLEKNSLEQVGLFRVPGHLKSIKTMKELIDNGEPYDVVFDSSKEKTNTICGLLKLFIREIPTSLIPDKSKNKIKSRFGVIYKSTQNRRRKQKN
jgi:RalA-binding protein 1